MDGDNFGTSKSIVARSVGGGVKSKCEVTRAFGMTMKGMIVLKTDIRAVHRTKSYIYIYTYETPQKEGFSRPETILIL